MEDWWSEIGWSLIKTFSFGGKSELRSWLDGRSQIANSFEASGWLTFKEV